MAKRRLPMRHLRQILKLKYHTGLTHRESAKACSIGAGTVSTYVARAREAGLTWPLPPELDDTTLEKRLFKLAQVAERSPPTPNICHGRGGSGAGLHAHPRRPSPADRAPEHHPVLRAPRRRWRSRCASRRD